MNCKVGYGHILKIGRGSNKNILVIVSKSVLR
jgi:hypothetical protein